MELGLIEVLKLELLILLINDKLELLELLESELSELLEDGCTEQLELRLEMPEAV